MNTVKYPRLYKPWERSRRMSLTLNSSFEITRVKLYYIKTPSRVFSCKCSENFQKCFFREHIWSPASKLFNTWIHLNIPNMPCCHVGMMCIYIRDWFGRKWDWNYIHGIEHEMWSYTIGESATGEKNRHKKKLMVDWKTTRA